MSYPNKITALPDLVRGDTYPGFKLVGIQLNEESIELLSVRSQLRSLHGALLHEFQITVEDNNLTFKPIPHSVTSEFPVTKVVFDVEVTLVDERVITIAAGSLNVLKDITYG